MASVAERDHALDIEFDVAELRSRFEQHLIELERRLHTAALTSALGRELVELISDRLNTARDRAVGKLKVVVIGDFKRGKSTLVNALLGAELAPSDVLPETLTINEFSFHEQSDVFLKLKGGGQVAVQRQDLRSSRLSELLQRCQRPVTHVEVRSASPLLREITLVDTPGTGDIRSAHEHLVSEYIDGADVLVVVVSATSPLSESEQGLLRTAVAPHEFGRIVFVLNMIDTVDPRDVARLTEHLRNKVHQIFPGSSVYPLSALSELQRVTGVAAAEGDGLARSFARFRAELDQIVSARAAILLLDRGLRRALLAVRELAQRIRWLEAELIKRRDNLQAALDQTRAEEQGYAASQRAVRDVVLTLGGVAAGWMIEFVAYLAAETPDQLSGATQAEVERDFPFFIADTIRSALTACLETHAAELADFIRTELQGVNAVHMQSLELVAAADLDSEFILGQTVDARSSDLALLGCMLGAGFAVSAVVSATELGIERFGRSQHIAQFAEGFARNVPHLQTRVRAAVERAYARMADNVEQQLSAAQLQEREAKKLAVQQASELCARNAEQVAVAQDQVHHCLALLQQMELDLLQLRRDLSADQSYSAT